MLGDLRSQDGLTLRVVVHGRLAIGVTAAAEERSRGAFALDHRLAARRAHDFRDLGSGTRLVAGLAGTLDVVAVGVARAAKELATLAEAFAQGLPATRALFGVGEHLCFGDFEGDRERLVELVENDVALDLLVFNLVELGL